MSRLIRAIVDTQALRANLARVRSVAPASRVMAVVKANAYGHGLLPVARALESVDAFAVARLDEAATLRDAGITRPIVLLEGVCSPAQLAEAAARGLDLVVHEPGQLALLEDWRSAHRFAVWLKVDTGMNRLGFRVEDFPAALARLRALTVPVATLRVLTHLSSADERRAPTTNEQVARFAAVTASLGLETSIGNSAGLLGWPDARGDWVRPGLALYGVSPFPGEVAASLGLAPVMTFETTVIATRRVLRGESVGYGATWRAARDSQIAILAAGYGDGLPRGFANGTPVAIQGHRAPLVGRVSMDMIAIDVTDVPDVVVGTHAELWGRTLPVEEVAPHAGTIAYELLCGVSQRVPLVITT